LPIFLRVEARAADLFPDFHERRESKAAKDLLRVTTRENAMSIQTHVRAGRRNLQSL